MTPQGKDQRGTGRALAMARRRAMSETGKAPSGSRPVAAASAASPAMAAPVPSTPAPAMPSPGRGAAPALAAGGARAASLARRRALSSQGKTALETKDRVRDGAGAVVKPVAKDQTGCGCGCGCQGARASETPARDVGASTRPARSKSNGKVKKRSDAAMNPTRALALARRHAQSTRGKAGLGVSGVSAAQAARAGNPDLSGRELARTIRELRAKRGGAGQKSSSPCGRQRPRRSADTGPAEPGPARDQPWKVGAGETSFGQTVTGTQVGRSRAVTGDEASTCRTVTGTEYMGADIFRAFCQSEPVKAQVRAGRSATSRGNQVTGNKVGRSAAVTGNEPGTCKRVTGTEYVGAEQDEAFCGARPEPGPARTLSVQTDKGRTVTGGLVGRFDNVTGNEAGADRRLTGTQYTQLGDGTVPPKVGASTTLRGGQVTGTLVGRRAKMTGDEPGTCKAITGDDYVGREQYDAFCAATPAPTDRKVGRSDTFGGTVVTGTMTGRSARVTGDEPGTCKVITGTPYAGAEQYGGYCDPGRTRAAAARMAGSRRAAAAPMTGIRPAVGGPLTGDDRGACETVTGTPYVGADQQAAACPAIAAEPGSPDFPQPLGDTPWGAFSIVSPNHAAEPSRRGAGVTGTGYELGQITGPFGMAPGKVTGTEEARFGRAEPAAAIPDTQPRIDGRVKSRVTGEGQDAGLRITGDDWDRGDRVTGTEGGSARRRNPTRRGGSDSVMAPLRVASRNEDLPVPVSKVTGGSGNTERGALVTYSGGARG